MAFSPDVSVFIDAVSRLSNADMLAYSEAAFKDIKDTSDIGQLHDIRTGIQANDPIPFLNRENDWEYMKDASGLASQCDDLPCDVATTMSLKTWSPAPYKCTLEFCSKDLDLPMLDYFNSVKLLDEFDENTFYIDFLKFMIADKLKKSLWTKAYFATTTGTSTALTGHNGLFVQYAAAAPDGNANRVDIAKNEGSTYVAQRLTADEGFTIVESINEAIEDNEKLRSRTDVEIRVTRSIARAYLKWLRTNKQVDCCERDPLTGIYTINNLTIYDTPIRVVNEWDQIITNIADFNNGTVKVNPHRAVATFKGSSPIGTPMAEKLEELKLKYDDYNEKAKFVSQYRIDAKVLQDDHFILAM